MERVELARCGLVTLNAVGFRSTPDGLSGIDNSRRNIVNCLERTLKKPGSSGGTKRSRGSYLTNRGGWQGYAAEAIYVGSLASQLCRVGNASLFGDGNS
jgi:hypothetical protein